MCFWWRQQQPCCRSSGTAAGLYVHRWRYGSFEEIAATLRVVAVVTVVVTMANIMPVLDHAILVSASIVAGFLAIAVMSGVRLVWRLLLDHWTRATGFDREPVIVMGAGEGGLQTVTAMLKSGPFHPVALLDDDPEAAQPPPQVCGCAAPAKRWATSWTPRVRRRW
ncbi:MAG: hypothetical protein M5U19_07035 [Microthrixaceae bacterium]|nr:hypothetical protein [Microthrixaceae bacterium]